MKDGTLAYPGYPFAHDGGQSIDWPEESWGLYRVAVNDRAPQNPDPTNPDSLTPLQPYVSAVSEGYATLASTYARANPLFRRFHLRQQVLAQSYGHMDTEWGTMYRVPGTVNEWQLDPFGAVKVRRDHLKRGLTVRLLEWDNKEAFLPRNRPDYIYFPTTGQWHYVQEDANTGPPRGRVPIFQLIPPMDSQFSALFGAFEEPAIPSAPVP